MSDTSSALVLALATENAELRAALAEAQELLVETAVDAGEMHAEVEALRLQIAQMLGCSPASFFEQSNSDYLKDASLLIQTWLAIKSPKGRDAVFAFVGEMLRSENR